MRRALCVGLCVHFSPKSDTLHCSFLYERSYRVRTPASFSRFPLAQSRLRLQIARMPDSDSSSATTARRDRDTPADDGVDHCRRSGATGAGQIRPRYLGHEIPDISQALHLARLGWSQDPYCIFKQGSGRSGMTAAAVTEL